MIPALLLALATVATTLGLGNLHSAARGADGALDPVFAAQATHAVIGVLGFSIVSRVRMDRLRDHARAIWLAAVVLLVVVLLHGTVAGGARSWLAFGPVRLQPAELVKLALPIAMAGELCRPDSATPRRRWAAIAVLVAVPVALIGAQPDLGSAGLVVLGAVAFAWLAGLPRWVWAAGVALAVLAAPIGWLSLKDYQQARILTFLDPTRDPTGDGYQTLQSLYAVASGGVTGVGFGAGTQGRLGFLPEHTTDFILAALAEEWGVIGGLSCLAVLGALVGAGLLVAERARDRFTALLAATLCLQLTGQVVVNVGGVLGLLPLTGVTLPFFSYGGSSLLSVWLCVGLLAAAARTPARLRVLHTIRPEVPHAALPVPAGRDGGLRFPPAPGPSPR